ncbi:MULTISPECIES: hypothetical protein [Desertifilum]|uniref:Uncharacterized protein n=1 Tax=Desertifilum tharense IPPAS B-1220 TaxID=1781255 RepID=A0ACD5H1G4_9CYAN|nr:MULTISPECIES: hypothetical protein [Desertifilum]MBD2325161.1 hypothetical protein [Desertifilum sp. FACHB-866]MBD2332697.1 hypothetical protein [Desertifilum sp. FACHB-868]
MGTQFFIVLSLLLASVVFLLLLLASGEELDGFRDLLGSGHLHCAAYDGVRL